MAGAAAITHLLQQEQWTSPEEPPQSVHTLCPTTINAGLMDKQHTRDVRRNANTCIFNFSQSEVVVNRAGLQRGCVPEAAMTCIEA